MVSIVQQDISIVQEFVDLMMNVVEHELDFLYSLIQKSPFEMMKQNFDWLMLIVFRYFLFEVVQLDLIFVDHIHFDRDKFAKVDFDFVYQQVLLNKRKKYYVFSILHHYLPSISFVWVWSRRLSINNFARRLAQSSIVSLLTFICMHNIQTIPNEYQNKTTIIYAIGPVRSSFIIMIEFSFEKIRTREHIEQFHMRFW